MHAGVVIFEGKSTLRLLTIFAIFEFTLNPHLVVVLSQLFNVYPRKSLT